MKNHIVKEDFLVYSWTLRIFIRGENDDRSYPGLNIASKIFEIMAAIFIDSGSLDGILECAQGFIYFLHPNLDHGDRIAEFVRFPNLVFSIKKRLFESNFPMKVSWHLLYILERLSQSTDLVVQAVFCNASDIEVV